MAPKYVQHRLTDGGESAHVLIRFEASDKGSVRRALRLLSRCALEVLVKARDADGTHKPAQAASREQEGSRWNG